MRYACLRNLFMKKRAGRVQRKMSVSIPGRRDCVSLERRDINFKQITWRTTQWFKGNPSWKHERYTSWFFTSRLLTQMHETSVVPNDTNCSNLVTLSWCNWLESERLVLLSKSADWTISGSVFIGDALLKMCQNKSLGSSRYFKKYNLTF